MKIDSKYKKKFRQKRKQVLVDYLGGKCIKCGYNKSISALDFHHINPQEKDFIVSSSVYSLSRMFNEVEKCILLCSNCHREFHYNEWSIDDIKLTKPKLAIKILALEKQRLNGYYKKCKSCNKEFYTKYKVKIYCNQKCYRKKKPM